MQRIERFSIAVSRDVGKTSGEERKDVWDTFRLEKSFMALFASQLLLAKQSKATSCFSLVKL